MKKLAIFLMTIWMSLAIFPVQVNANIPTMPSTETTAPKPESAEVKTLERRLHEIKAMDRSKMKASEKKKLRKEVKSIKNRLNDLSNGFYVSAGALIIVAILLILLI